MGVIGRYNAEIINNLSVNIIEHSYSKPYIKMSPEYFQALKWAKRSNYEKIYLTPEVADPQREVIRPMFIRLYDRLEKDLLEKNRSSPIYKHHIEPISQSPYKRETPYEEEDIHTIITDYIASMTDDYFVDLHEYFFPEEKSIDYKGYFL